MPLTGKLGKAVLGQFQLANPGAMVGPSLDQDVQSVLNLQHGVTVSKTLNVSASNTLVLTQTLTQIEPITVFPCGFTGGQARYVHVRDITSNFDLYLRDPDFQFTYPASTVKMMTALLVLDYVDLTDPVTFIGADFAVPGGLDMAGFGVGDVTDFEGVLYGILLPSGADACMAAARIIGTLIYTLNGSVGNTGVVRFVEEMNLKAAALGMGNTNYTDPYGYSQSGATIYNVVSARDTSIVCEALFAYADARTIAGTAVRTQPVTGVNPRDLNFESFNNFINGPTLNPAGIKDPNVVGGKNGAWLSGASHYNISILWVSPGGNEVVITVFNAESLYELMLDVQGIIYMICRDFSYLCDSVPIGIDTDFDKVKLLVGGDGSIVDESDVGRALTNNSVTVGDPVIESEGGLVFNADTDYVRVTNDDADLQIGSGDGTIEIYYAGPAVTLGFGEWIFFAKADHTGTPRREWLINYFMGALQLFVSSDGTGWNNTTLLSMTTEQRNTFFNGAPRHIAIVKEGSTWSAYINGERMTNTLTVGTLINTTMQVSIGYVPSNNSPPGRADDFRMTVGKARYTLEKETLSGRMFPRTGTGIQDVQQFLNLTHTAHASLTINRSVEHTLNLTHAAKKVVDVEAESTLVLDHEAIGEKYRFVNASSALALMHDVVREMEFNRTVNQALVLNHSATKQMSFARSITSNLTLAQSAIAVASKHASNTLVLSHQATAEYVKGARNTLTLTQSVDREMIYNRQVHSNLIPFQVVNLNATFRRTVAQVLNLTQLATVQLVKAASNHLNLSHLATCYVAKSAFSSLNLLQNALASMNYKRDVQSTLLLDHTAIVTKSKAVSAFNALGLNQHARGTVVHNVSAQNTLVLSQDLVQRRFNEEVAQALVLDHEALGQKVAIREASNVLVLSQSVQLSKTIVRSVAHTLVFKTETERRTGVSSLPIVTVPNVQVTVTRKKCVMILEAGSNAITLPCPEFNDGEGSTIQLSVKRAMDGTRRAYVRNNPTNTLNYDLVMDRLKALELRQFLLQHNSSVLKLTNFKGEIWIVLLTNSPFAFTEDGYRNSLHGNRSTISLEFEGVRLN